MRRRTPPEAQRIRPAVAAWIAAALAAVGCSSEPERHTPTWADAAPVVHRSRTERQPTQPARHAGPVVPDRGATPTGTARTPRTPTDPPDPERSLPDLPDVDPAKGSAPPDAGPQHGTAGDNGGPGASAPIGPISPISPNAGDHGTARPGAAVGVVEPSPPADAVVAVADATDQASEPLDPREAKQRAGRFLERLQGEEEDARKAYEELCRVDPRLIPALIRHVQSDRKTKLRELAVVVLQKNFARYDDAADQFVYLIDGLSPFLLDDIATGKVRFGRYRGASRVRITRFDGFPVGVVVRAALLNRIKGRRFPPYRSSTRQMARWWRDYHRMATAKAERGAS